MANTRFEGALHMLAKGLKIFPVAQNAKHPAVMKPEGWSKTATEEMRTAHVAANPTSNWAVHAGASGLCVIDLDIDKAKGKDGIKALADLEKAAGECVPSTFKVRTPRGGYHLYFWGHEKSGANVLADGIDIRSTGAYVVAPGSTIEDKDYHIVDDINIAPLPDWIKESLGGKKKKEKPLQEGKSISEGSRNNVLTQIAGKMRSDDHDYESILASLMSLNETKLDRPLPQNEIETIAKSVSRYSPDTVIGDMAFAPTPEKLIAVRGEVFKNLPKRNWVMEGRYIRGFVSVLVSPGGVGKSTIAMLDAISIATGKALSGSEVEETGPVWLYNTEDTLDEVKRRFAALIQHHNLEEEPKINDVHLTGCEIPLVFAKLVKNDVAVNDDAVKLITDYINANKITTLIMDPFVRTHAVNENDNMQIDRVVQCFQSIAKNTNCAICVIHHTRKPGTGKDLNGSADSARGASALINAARISHTLGAMDDKLAAVFGIPLSEAPWCVRLDAAKGNLRPPGQGSQWFKRKSIELDNGDCVGSIELVDLRSIEAGLSAVADKEQVKRLGFALSKIMKAGDQVAANVLLQDLAGIDEFFDLFVQKRGQAPPLFKANGGEKGNKTRSRKEFCNTIEDNDVTYGDLKFGYLDYGARQGNASRYFITCVKEAQEDDFLG